MTEEVIVKMVKNNTQRTDQRSPLGIIGTGNYAMALCKRLTASGFYVIIASRCPEKRKLTLSTDHLSTAIVTSISDCLQKCDVIFVAIHGGDFKATLEKFVPETKDKILIDVSNRTRRYSLQSNADLLTSILPYATVVKAFNSISAFTMEDVSSSGSNQKAFIASNDPKARSVVADVAKDMGFSAVDLGGLKSAVYMEDFVLKVFARWQVPLLLTFGIFNLWMFYVVYIYYIEATEFTWEQIFLKVLNKPLCMTAVTTLALTYLAGHVAAITQIYNGTKHKPFHRVLDSWLKSRKQLGLISLVLVSGHVVASALMLSPTYYSSWFHSATVTLPVNVTLGSDVVLPVTSSWMQWKGEAACLAGISAFILMAIIGLTSIPSVGESLNWSEWRCIHSKLSYLVLILATAHVLIMAVPNWVKDGPVKTLKSITFLSLFLPLIVLFLKLIFSCPPLKGYVCKIRRGWERNTSPLPVTLEKSHARPIRLKKLSCSQNGLRVSGGCCQAAPNGPEMCCCSGNGTDSLNAPCQCPSMSTVS